MQASVTDWPYFSPLGPDGGISWRPSIRLLSIMTPMMKDEVSSDDSSCWAWRWVESVLTALGVTVNTHDVVGNLNLLLMLLGTVSVTAVNLKEKWLVHGVANRV